MIQLKRAIALRIALWLVPPRPKSEVVTENPDGSVTVKAVYGSLAEAKRARRYSSASIINLATAARSCSKP